MLVTLLEVVEKESGKDDSYHHETFSINSRSTINPVDFGPKCRHKRVKE